jgi:hypothetical protein
MKPRIQEDSPDPLRVTPKRLADELGQIGDQLGRLANRVRPFALLLDAAVRDDVNALYDSITVGSRRAVDLAASIRFGGAAIVQALVDTAAGRGERPLLDRIESAPAPAGPAAGYESVLTALPGANGAAEPEPAKRSAKAPAKFAWEVWAFNSAGMPVSLCPITVPTRDPERALEYARQAVTEGEDKLIDIDRSLVPVDPAKLKVLRMGSPEAVKFASESERAPAWTGGEVVAAGEYTLEELGLGGQLDRIEAAYSGDTIASNGKLRGVIAVKDRLYANVGGLMKGGTILRVDLVKLVPLESWTGASCTYAERAMTRPHKDFYNSVRVEHKGQSYVMLGKLGRLNIVIPPAAETVPQPAEPAPVESEPEPAEAPEKTVKIPTDAEERKARRRENDAKYQAKKREKRLLDKAIGNRVESAGPVDRREKLREPVLGPTVPAKSLATPAHWASVPIAELQLTDASKRALADGMKFKTAGDVADWLATNPKAPWPTPSATPWPEVVEIAKVAIELVKKLHEQPAEPPADVECCSVLSPCPEGYQRVYSVHARETYTRAEIRAGAKPQRLGEVIAANIDEAKLAAARRFGVRPVEVGECMVDGGKGQKIVRVPRFDVLDLKAVDKKGQYKVLGTIDAPNSARARIIAEKRWSDLPPDRLNIRNVELRPAESKPRKPKPKPAPEPDPLENLFIYWGQGKGGKQVNPVYGIKAPSLTAAVAWVDAHHPKDHGGQVRPDLDGTIVRRKVPVVVDLVLNPAAHPDPPPAELATPTAAGQIDLCTLHGQPPLPAGHERVFSVYDSRTNPPTVLGEIAGANITRAMMAAEAQWPDVPKRMLAYKPKLAPGTKHQATRPANRLVDPDVELAEFRRSFDVGADRAQWLLEQRSNGEPDLEPEPAESEASG